MSRSHSSNGHDSNYDSRRDTFSSRGGSYRGRGGYGSYRDSLRSGYNGGYSSRDAYHSHRQPYRSGGSKDSTSEATSQNEERSHSNNSAMSHEGDVEGSTNYRTRTPVKSGSADEDNRGKIDSPEVESYQQGRYGGEYRGSYGGGSRGSGEYRGGYRGGNRGYRGGFYNSPYSRGSNGTLHSSSSKTPTDSRGSNSPYHHGNHGSEAFSHQAGSQRLQRSSQPAEIKYNSPWIKLLSLDDIKTTDKTLEPEYIKLRKEREDMYKTSQRNQDKLEELKLRNLKLDFEIDTLKVYAARDQLNVDSTQEKLDAISLL